MEKRVIVDTKQKRGIRFRVSSDGPRIRVYAVTSGFLLDNNAKVGEAKSLEDAIVLIRASVPGEIIDLRIE
jgi:hypothetical protein